MILEMELKNFVLINRSFDLKLCACSLVPLLEIAVRMYTRISILLSSLIKKLIGALNKAKTKGGAKRMLFIC